MSESGGRLLVGADVSLVAVASKKQAFTGKTPLDVAIEEEEEVAESGEEVEEDGVLPGYES